MLLVLLLNVVEISSFEDLHAKNQRELVVHGQF